MNIINNTNSRVDIQDSTANVHEINSYFISSADINHQIRQISEYKYKNCLNSKPFKLSIMLQF